MPHGSRCLFVAKLSLTGCDLCEKLLSLVNCRGPRMELTMGCSEIVHYKEGINFAVRRGGSSLSWDMTSGAIRSEII